jgi:hypothetical protein
MSVTGVSGRRREALAGPDVQCAEPDDDQNERECNAVAAHDL